MTIKDIRKKTGLTQKSFSEYYHIPLQTLKQWESDKDSSSHRMPPEYVVHMIGRLASFDFGENAENKENKPGRVAYLEKAALHSRYNAKQWLRYLRKELKEGISRLSPEEIHALTESEVLTMYQKISLKRAMEHGTDTNLYVSGLNERSKTPMLDRIMRKHGHV